MNNYPRRSFLKKSMMTAGLASMGSVGGRAAGPVVDRRQKLPREVWIAGVSQMGMKTRTAAEMVKEIFGILDKLMIYQPDVVCLPEVFITSNIEEKLTTEEKARIAVDFSGVFSDFARKNNCYLIYPVYTSDGGRYYNAAVVYNRQGIRIGEYRKIRLTEGEINLGLTPGPLSPPVFEADFGKIGIQICFDLLWEEGWFRLREKGADVVFWPSAYAGGRVIHGRAWQHKYVVATATRKNTSRLCDITGEVIAQTGIWDPNFYCAPVNLEKAFLHTWPYVRSFDAIRKKYGRDIRITTFHEEEWTVIESLTEGLTIREIIREFDLKTFEQHTREAELIQAKHRLG